MKLETKSFEDNGMIDQKYTCDGDNISPDLVWSEVPEGTKSFALSCLDPDSPSGEFAHWLWVNIPSEVRELSEVAHMPSGAVAIENDFGYGDYGGPCPGSGVHRYVFTVYALSVEKLEGVTRDNFTEKVSESLIDRGEVVGRYGRK